MISHISASDICPHSLAERISVSFSLPEGWYHELLHGVEERKKTKEKQKELMPAPCICVIGARNNSAVLAPVGVWLLSGSL